MKYERTHTRCQHKIEGAHSFGKIYVQYESEGEAEGFPPRVRVNCYWLAFEALGRALVSAVWLHGSLAYQAKYRIPRPSGWGIYSNYAANHNA